MSVITSKTGLSSILKSYTSTQRDKAKNAAINKVRFELPKLKGLVEVVNDVCENNNYQLLNEFVEFIKQTILSDQEFLTIFNDARKVCSQLSPKFTNLVETLLEQQWIKRNEEAVQAYSNFATDIVVTHNKYAHFLVPKLIMLWIPADGDVDMWLRGTPNDEKKVELQPVHLLLGRILTVIPMTFNVVLESIENKFPYFKKAPHMIAGFVHNLLWLMEYQPSFTDYVMQILAQKLVILDVNAPRCEIEDSENQDDAEEEYDEGENENENFHAEEGLFQMDDCDEKEDEDKDETPMNHPFAHTLDLCMTKIFTFFDAKNPTQPQSDPVKHQIANNYFKVLLNTFDNVMLTCHNTHHVQFLMFYYCSFKQVYAEAFLSSLWEKVRNVNASAIIRQTSVGYLASYLARCRHLPVTVLRHYIKEMSDFAHQYIERCDQYRSNGSLKANIVFFSVCQAIFYVIAFRSRALTSDKKGLLYLQTLRLSALVTCNFNPLRYCLPAIATAFAGVTRAHQLAYCHAVLERNARRKLATVYTNGTETAEDTLDIFFPFDPYLLKLSSTFIEPHYLQYQASEAEEHNSTAMEHERLQLSRKRCESEMVDDQEDMDDFLLADKRRKKLKDCAKSFEKETQFTYGLSPGFHT